MLRRGPRIVWLPTPLTPSMNLSPQRAEAQICFRSEDLPQPYRNPKAPARSGSVRPKPPVALSPLARRPASTQPPRARKPVSASHRPPKLVSFQRPTRGLFNSTRSPEPFPKPSRLMSWSAPLPALWPLRPAAWLAPRCGKKTVLQTPRIRNKKAVQHGIFRWIKRWKERLIPCG